MSSDMTLHSLVVLLNDIWRNHYLINSEFHKIQHRFFDVPYFQIAIICIRLKTEQTFYDVLKLNPLDMY